MATAIADTEPTFDLPDGGATDVYYSREVNDRDSSNNGKILKRHGMWRYPFLARRTGDSLQGTYEEIQSNELRHGRTPGKNKLGNASSSGSLDFELSPVTFDDNLEGVFRDKWISWTQDGFKNGICKDFKTTKGRLHVNGDPGTYNQWYDDSLEGKRVTEVPVFYTGDETGTRADPFGIVKVSADKLGNRSVNPLGKFIAHELHVGNTPVKYSVLNRVPITDKTVRYENFSHVEMGEMNLSVTVNSIVTGSFQQSGSNNPDWYTEGQETGKKRMAVNLGEKKSVATGTGEDFYSEDFKDAAEKFIATARKTVKSTETDQFTALDGFLYLNGHQLQYCSDLTLDLNNNLTPVNAIFVKNAIANLAPNLTVSGNITAYFTDGEKDATGRKFGTDDIKNLNSNNKDAEVLFAFVDKEDPDVVYLFQVFKATIGSPSDSKSSGQPASSDFTFTSYGEMAVRILRFAIPKVRDIELDVNTVVESIRDGSTVKSIGVTVIPNVPLDNEDVTVTAGKFSSGDYVDSANTNGLYMFHDAEVTVIDAEGNSTVDEDAGFSGAVINADGTVSATLTLTNALNEGDSVKVKLNVNGEEYEESNTVEPDVPYLRMGENYRTSKYSAGYISVDAGDTLNVLTEGEGSADEDSLVFKSYDGLLAKDLKVKCDSALATAEGAGITVAGTAAEGTEINVTVESAYDDKVYMEFKVVVGEPDTAEEPVFSNTLTNQTYDVGDTATALDGTATVTDGGTVTYSWKVDGAEVATTAQYTPATGEAGSKTVTVTATNTNGTATATSSQTITVTVSEQ